MDAQYRQRQPPRARNLFCLILCSVLGTLAYFIPAFYAELYVPAIISASACLASVLLLLPLLDNARTCPRLLVFMSSLVLVAWIPTAAWAAIEHEAAPPPHVISISCLALLALGASHATLLPSMPLWTTALPPVPSAIALLIVVAVMQEDADVSATTVPPTLELGRSLVACAAGSLSVALLLLFLRPGAGTDLDSAVVSPMQGGVRSRVVSYEDADSHHQPHYFSHRHSSSASSTRRSISSGVVENLTGLGSRISRGVRSSSSTIWATNLFGRRSSDDHGERPTVDLRSNLDLARNRLKQLETNLSSHHHPLLAKELSKAIDLLQSSKGFEGANSKLDEQLFDEGVDDETASFLRSTLSAHHQRELMRRRNTQELGEISSTRRSSFESEEESNNRERMKSMVESVSRSLDQSERSLASSALTDWGADLIELNSRTNGHALLVFGMEVFKKHDLLRSCNLEEETLTTFLMAMEEGYGSKYARLTPFHHCPHPCSLSLTSLFLLLSCTQPLSQLDPCRRRANVDESLPHELRPYRPVNKERAPRGARLCCHPRF